MNPVGTWSCTHLIVSIAVISLESSDSECEETKQKTQKKTKGKKKTKAEAKSPKDDKKTGDNDKTDDKECAEVKDNKDDKDRDDKDKVNKDKDNKDKDNKDKDNKDKGDKDTSETLENGLKTEDSEDKDKQQENDDELKVEGESKKKVVVPVIDSNKKCHEADLQALEEVQNMEDRISSASLQSKVVVLNTFSQNITHTLRSCDNANSIS